MPISAFGGMSPLNRSSPSCRTCSDALDASRLFTCSVFNTPTVGWSAKAQRTSRGRAGSKRRFLPGSSIQLVPFILNMTRTSIMKRHDAVLDFHGAEETEPAHSQQRLIELPAVHFSGDVG